MLWCTEDEPSKKAMRAEEEEKESVVLIWQLMSLLFLFFPLSRSVAVKEMFCIFWMRAIPAMPTGCGLSIRRLHRSRRTWQPFRYISTLQTMNPSDLPERKKMINITDICQTSKPEVRNYVNYFKFDLRKYGNLIFFWKKPWKQDRNDRLFSAAIYCFCCVKNHRCACEIK